MSQCKAITNYGRRCKCVASVCGFCIAHFRMMDRLKKENRIINENKVIKE